MPSTANTKHTESPAVDTLPSEISSGSTPAGDDSGITREEPAGGAPSVSSDATGVAGQSELAAPAAAPQTRAKTKGVADVVFLIDVTGSMCLDIGTSTGGFMDCLLQRGAARVIGVDTGHGQVAFRLRQDSRVQLLEKTNARYLTREQLSGQPIDFIAVDVSFISATLVLPAVVSAAFPDIAADRAGRKLIVLVKPQFEAGRENVGKGGLVRDPGVHRQVIEKVRDCIVQLGALATDVTDSPILGAEGNREFLLLARF